MSERSAFFNGRQWRRLLNGDEQAVRFLEELWQRSGGGKVPDINLDQVVNLITQVDESVRVQGLDVSALRRAVSNLASESQHTNAHIKALERKIQPPEADALQVTVKRLQQRIDQLETHNQMLQKQLEHRISQLEDAQ